LLAAAQTCDFHAPLGSGPKASRPEQARRAIFAAVSLVKRVAVVDADIDPWDPVAVDWARVNRIKLERDLLLVPHAGTDRSEPMEDGGLVTKSGFDATAKASDRVEGIERALPPQAQRDDARMWRWIPYVRKTVVG
jgi:4-hydroxy-3-polyprenylbenzoate decarboxylase